MMVGQAVHLQNGFNDWNGGYLDIRGAGCEGNAYCVSTSSRLGREHMRAVLFRGSWVHVSALRRRRGEQPEARL